MVAIVIVWVLEWVGYMPCELCLKERVPYYIGVPLALAVALATRSRLAVVGYAVLAALFVAGALLATYHAGVEWKFWAGPASCTGLTPTPTDVSTFLKQLNTMTLIQCDAAAFRVLGLSLAGWDCVVSVVLMGFAVAGARYSACSQH